jgi:hypothetical protein
MPIELTPSQLFSRATRTLVAENGKRLISLDLSFSEIDDGNEGVIGKIIQAGQQLSGFLLGATFNLAKWGLSRINFQAIFSWLVTSTAKLAVFDWNASDTELNAIISAQNLQLYSIWGGAFGQTIGWITGVGLGYGIGLAFPVIGGSALARTIASATSLEAIEEIMSAIRLAITQTVEVKANNAALRTYMGFRSAIKRIPSKYFRLLWGADNQVETAIKDYWGAEKGSQWSFASQIEKSIENIASKKWEMFVEEAVDEFFDSFIEAGFIIANELDTAYAQYKMQNDRAVNTTARAVTITPDYVEPQHSYYISGTETEVKDKVINAITQSRVIGTREIGEFVGMPVDDYLRARPHQRKATVIFKTIEGRAWYGVDGKKARQVTYTIPDLRTNLDWERIKRQCRAYEWGEWRATANLTNGRQMAVYGATGAIAEDKLRELLELSTAEMLTLAVSQEKDRDIRRKKHPMRVYPYKLKLLIRKFDKDGSSYIDMEGNAYDEYNYAIPLWTDNEPREWQEVQLY